MYSHNQVKCSQNTLFDLLVFVVVVGWLVWCFVSLVNLALFEDSLASQNPQSPGAQTPEADAEMLARTFLSKAR